MKKEIQKFIDLVKENPDLPVICMVDSDVVLDDSYGWWLADIGYSKVGEYALYNEHYYDDRESFKEEYYDRNDDILCERFGYDPRICFMENYTKSEVEENKKAGLALEKYLDSVADKAFRQAIMLWIRTPDSVDEFMQTEARDETDI